MGQVEQAKLAENSIAFVFSLLTWPAAIATLVVIGVRSAKRKQFIDALPLLATQLNTAFTQMSVAIYEVGVFNYGITETSLLKGGYFS